MARTCARTIQIEIAALSARAVPRAWAKLGQIINVIAQKGPILGSDDPNQSSRITFGRSTCVFSGAENGDTKRAGMAVRERMRSARATVFPAAAADAA